MISFCLENSNKQQIEKVRTEMTRNGNMSKFGCFFFFLTALCWLDFSLSSRNQKVKAIEYQLIVALIHFGVYDILQNLLGQSEES